MIFALSIILYTNWANSIENSLWPKVENRAFAVGEKLTYVVKWKGIAGGTAVMEIREIVRISDRDAYRVTLSTRSSGFFDIFLKIRDFLESYIDKECIFTWKQRKRLRGGKYRADRETIYDQTNHLAFYRGKKIEIPSCVQDSLSSFYYLRTQKLTEGESIVIDANDDGKNFLVEVKVGKLEKVATSSGRFEACKTEVLWKRKGKPDIEKSYIWFTNDEKKIPVRIEKQSKSGTITMLLKEARF